MNKSKFLTFFLILFLIFSQLIVFQFVPSVKANPDWLTGWSYRKSHIINNATGAGTLYQVPIIVINASNTDSGNITYINNKTRTDFGDVRFTDDDGTTLLDYWMETLNTGINATFWVEVADSLESANQTIYVYYGKADATTTSNGDNTFLFFDDFPGTSLDLAKWDIVSGTPVVASSICTLDLTDMISGDVAYAIGKRFKARSKYANLYYEEFLSGYYDDSNMIAMGRDDAVPYHYSRTYNAGTHTTLDIGDGSGAYHLHEFTWKSGEVKFYRDGTLKATHTTNIPTNNLKPRFHAAAGQTGRQVDIDWVFISKFVSPEPAHGAWGSEETGGVAYTVDLTQTITTTLSSVAKTDFTLTISQPVTSAFTPSLNWNGLLNLQSQPSITLTQASKTDFILAFSSQTSASFTKTEKTDYTLNPSSPITATFTSTPKSDFTLQISSPNTISLSQVSKTDFALTFNAPATSTFNLPTIQWNAILNIQATPTITCSATTKSDFTLTIQNPTTPSLTLSPQWNAILNPQFQPSITLEKVTKTDFIITTSNPISTSWTLDIIHTISGGVQYFVDLSTSITTSFEMVKQWFANIIITTQPTVTLTQISQSDFTLTFTNPITTGWILDVTIPTIPTGPTGGSWPPAKISLFTQAYNVLAGIWQFTWTQEVPVSVNVTIINQSPYTSGTLHYRIINLDTNTTVVDWTVGEAVLIDAEGNTTVTIQTTVPIQRNFNAEHFRAKVKLSLISQTIEGQADFTVEKDMVKQFYSNVALLSLCLALVGVAVYSYKQKPEPWKKYPTEQKRKKYPERKGKS